MLVAGMAFFAVVLLLHLVDARERRIKVVAVDLIIVGVILCIKVEIFFIRLRSNVLSTCNFLFAYVLLLLNFDRTVLYSRAHDIVRFFNVEPKKFFQQ
mmetsp:Transcript_18589/g.25589  ORF Transcript_18589/g.25589 Transcript_18589/m.25589 type:complete len:98 (+) Transcript_18589:1365-1658(+)